MDDPAMSSPPRRHATLRRLRSRLCRSRPQPGRVLRLPPGAARGRSWAARRYRAAVCRAGASPPCGLESAPEYEVRSLETGFWTRLKRAEFTGIGGRFAPLYGLPERGQTDI